MVTSLEIMLAISLNIPALPGKSGINCTLMHFKVHDGLALPASVWFKVGEASSSTSSSSWCWAQRMTGMGPASVHHAHLQHPVGTQ